MTSDVRWKQRFENFEKAFQFFGRRYDDHLKNPNDESNQAAFVKSFELTLELSWKVMKDVLVEGGVKKRLKLKTD